MLHKFWHMTLPITVVRLYRLQPAKMRGAIWRPIGFTIPTSHLAIPLVRGGGGWTAVWNTFWASGPEWD
jgi:hypothetical protein